LIGNKNIRPPEKPKIDPRKSRDNQDMITGNEKLGCPLLRGGLQEKQILCYGGGEIG